MLDIMLNRFERTVEIELETEKYKKLNRGKYIVIGACSICAITAVALIGTKSIVGKAATVERVAVESVEIELVETEQGFNASHLKDSNKGLGCMMSDEFLKETGSSLEETEYVLDTAAYDICEAEDDEIITEDATQVTVEAEYSVENTTFSEDEMLARIAMAEAEGEDTEGKALVIRVVLNRLASDEFPDDIYSIITEEDQFEGYSCGRYSSLEPSDDCWAALNMVKDGWDESNGALYFEANSLVNSWQSRNLTKLFVHGGHTFYK